MRLLALLLALSTVPPLLGGCALPLSRSDVTSDVSTVPWPPREPAPVATPARPAEWRPTQPPVLPPYAWQQGRPEFMADSTLAPRTERMQAADPARLPLDTLRRPAGFQVEVWASGLPGVRTLARTPGGRLYAGSGAAGQVYEITDVGTQRTVRVVARDFDHPGVATLGEQLYVLSGTRVLRYEELAAQRDGAPTDLSTAFDLPEPVPGAPHALRAGPDGRLYVAVTAPCNICEPPDGTAQIRRYSAKGSDREVLASGVRKAPGMAWHPLTGELWFTVAGRDWLGDDTPEDGIYRLSRPALDVGFPYCHLGRIPDPDVRRDHPCAGVVTPVVSAGPHAGAEGLLFYTGRMFPADYRNALLVARKGSWNRHTLSGYDLVMVQTAPDGRRARLQPWIRGFADPLTGSVWGRPVDLLQMPDGAVLVSDEEAGAIYRVSYTGNPGRSMPRDAGAPPTRWRRKQH